ncbi:MAG: hypothetical protein ACOCTR_02045 [Candidatus Natronoplasma sp.]
MALKDLKKQISERLYSNSVIRTSVILIIVLGFFFLWMGIAGSNHLRFHFLTSLGISLVVGTIFGFWAGSKLGWPLGFWAGVIMGLIFSPLISARLKGAFASYFATFLGPAVGGVIGKWTEWKDKKIIKEKVVKKKSYKERELNVLNKKE